MSLNGDDASNSCSDFNQEIMYKGLTCEPTWPKNRSNVLYFTLKSDLIV